MENNEKLTAEEITRIMAHLLNAVMGDDYLQATAIDNTLTFNTPSTRQVFRFTTEEVNINA